jgi:hypothetical protein
MKAKGLSALYCVAVAVGCAAPDTANGTFCTGADFETLGCGESTGANEKESPAEWALMSSNIMA